MDKVDCIVIGAGVVGMAIARAIALTGREVVVLEMEAEIGSHTSSRNSEVIHAGIYYPPDSLKAKYCLQGKARLYDYCQAKGIAHRKIGKLILATSKNEINTLKNYQQRATQNGLHDLQWLNANEIADLEPSVRCKAGLLSPSTGILDSHEMLLSLLADIEAGGGSVICRSRVTAVRKRRRGFTIQVSGTEGFEIDAELVVNSAGLWAPEVADMIASESGAQAPGYHFAKGHYFSLSGQSPFRHLIYPVATTGGLGVHVTMDLSGHARFGPDVQWIDSIDYDFSAGRKPAFAQAIREYYPEIDESRLTEGYTGIRPKLSGPGESAADFSIHGVEHHGIEGLVHLYGIESPGLTASLAIADQVAATIAMPAQ
jgi:L-2-hydroxyglutarate oxidase LhgO